MRGCAIDIGSNTLLAATFEMHSGGLATLSEREWVTGLGRGMAETERLNAQGCEVVRAALLSLANEARILGLDTLRAVGTSAMRDALDGAEFARAMRVETGIEVEIVSGEREAALTFGGASHGLEVSGPRCAVDIGGRSTELAWGDDAQLLGAVSLPLGSVRLYEEFLPDTGAEARESMRARIRTTLASIAPPSGPLVFLAGTANTISEVARLRWGGPVTSTLSVERIDRVAELFAETPVAGRAALPGMPSGRADVALAGGVLLSEIARWAGPRTLMVGDGGVRWGLAHELARELRGS
jgi:exopolyphosphatase / guanosine-5'-triphosphate,3'-diphosphate pyrophosphatase